MLLFNTCIDDDYVYIYIFYKTNKIKIHLPMNILNDEAE